MDGIPLSELRFGALVIIPADGSPVKNADCGFYGGHVMVHYAEDQVEITAFGPINPTYDAALRKLLGEALYEECARQRPVNFDQATADAIIARIVRDPIAGYGA